MLTDHYFLTIRNNKCFLYGQKFTSPYMQHFTKYRKEGDNYCCGRHLTTLCQFASPQKRGHHTAKEIIITGGRSGAS